MPTITKLNKWYDDENGIYTRDTWIIPETGATITEEYNDYPQYNKSEKVYPYGDGCHVKMENGTVYHCDELMGKLEKNVDKWAIDVKMTREQQIDGRWERVVV